jgi:hypothetical protein
MTSRLKFSVLRLLLAGLPGSAAAATCQQETTGRSKNSHPVDGNWGFDRPSYRDKFNCGGFLERLRRNHQNNSGHHYKGWGNDAYSEGDIFVGWTPAMYRNARLSAVCGGRVIDPEYHLHWLDSCAIHAAIYPFVNHPDDYRSTNPPSEP